MIRDIDCNIDTPVTYGKKCCPIYGDRIIIHPEIASKNETAYEKGMYLGSLFPLEDYDKIIIMFSGGKDSLALVELLGKRSHIFKPRFSVVAVHVVMKNIP